MVNFTVSGGKRILRGNYGSVSRLNLRFTEWEMVVFMVLFSSGSDLTSLDEVLRSKDVKKWKQVADEEYVSFIKNRTWNLQKFLSGRKVIINK